MHDTKKFIIIIELFVLFILVGLFIAHINIMINKRKLKNKKIQQQHQVKSNKLKVDDDWEQLNQV